MNQTKPFNIYVCDLTGNQCEGCPEVLVPDLCDSRSVNFELKVAFPNAGENFSREELTKAFDEVKNKDNWKQPISAWVHLSNLEVTLEAIKYFTATEGRIVRTSTDECSVLIHADGYYMGPAGP